jgi:Ser/Thr protein kinase RdoA (MazF antagonist)
MMARVTRDSFPAPAHAVLDAFDLVPQSLERAPSGLINATWYARSRAGASVVLQRLNPIFPAVVNLDIAAVTRHLEAKGLVTPLLVASRFGELWFEHERETWRVLTRVAGITRDALETTAQAGEAGRVLAEFHAAVADLDHAFHSARLGVHDTPRHLRELRAAVDEFRSHREIAAIRPLAERVLRLAETLPGFATKRDRIVHGDPKISNVVFAPDSDRGVCLIDLDTLARMPVALELGDAMRSWCNPATEDAAAARFSRPLFTAAVEGYAAAGRELLGPDEWGAIPAATVTITVELAARFCTDALRERYFRWDERRYPSATAHNQARARGQLQLAEAMLAELPELTAITARAFAG